MKTYVSLILFFSLFTISFESSAQYRIPKTERIYTPWDADTTLIDYARYGIVNITEDGKLVMLAYPYPEHKLRFYLYNDIQKTWLTKYIDSSTSINRSIVNNYTVGLKRVGSSVYEGTVNDTNYIGTRWVFNYGDSVFWDTAKMPFYPDRVVMVSPSVSYYSKKDVWPPRQYGNNGVGPMLRAYDSYLYKRFYTNGKESTTSLFSLYGSFGSSSGNDRYYENDINFGAIDDETVVAAIRRHYWEPSISGSQSKSDTEEYNMITTNSGQSWTRGAYNPYNLPSRNIDNQWFLMMEPALYLYSSPRHGITPKKPVYVGYINELLDSTVQRESVYIDGKKGSYCLCNSKIDTSKEVGNFIIYQLNAIGDIKKYFIPKSTFEFPSVFGTDTLFYDREIFYADDSIMYIKVITGGYLNNDNYHSQPQLYKIYLKETLNSVAEQPAVTPLQLYPNPTDHTLRWNTSSGTAIITDALGRQLIEVPASAMEADVSALAVGMYYLTIQNGMESTIRAFLVVR